MHLDAAAPSPAASLTEVLAQFQGVRASSPRLTWYGPDGERVELSGRVLANWIIKAANLLQEEADCSAGSTVAIDLPCHWRAVVWSMAAWVCGAEVVILPDGGSSPGADVAISWRPLEFAVAHPEAASALRVAVALPALAMSFDGKVPAGAIDGAADLMTYPDVLVMPPLVEPDAAAIGDVTHGDLLAWARAGSVPAERALVGTADPIEGVRSALGSFARGASLVLVGDELGAEALARLRAVEGVTNE